MHARGHTERGVDLADDAEGAIAAAADDHYDDDEDHDDDDGEEDDNDHDCGSLADTAAADGDDGDDDGGDHDEHYDWVTDDVGGIAD